MVEQAVRDPRLLGDVADAGRVVAAAREDADGRVEDDATLLRAAGELSWAVNASDCSTFRGGATTGRRRRRPDPLPAGRVRLARAAAPGSARRAGRAAGGGSDAPRRAGLGRGAERGQGVGRLRPEAERELAQALLARADVVLEGFRPAWPRASASGRTTRPPPPSTARSRASARGPHAGRAGHDQLRRLGRDARGHCPGCRRSSRPTWPPARSRRWRRCLAALLERTHTGRGARLAVSMTHGSHRLVSHRLGGDPCPGLPHRPRVLPDLRDLGRAAPHGRGTGAEVLRPPLRADRTP